MEIFFYSRRRLFFCPVERHIIAKLPKQIAANACEMTLRSFKHNSHTISVSSHRHEQRNIAIGSACTNRSDGGVVEMLLANLSLF